MLLMYKKTETLPLAILLGWVGITIVLSGCSPAFWEGCLVGLSDAYTYPSYSQPQKEAKLMLFGGKNHDVFLGCLSCNKYDSESVWNEYGDYGSRYSSNSIWNPYGDYGSKYSDYSPWNSYASYPPVIVDSYGNFYGYFTANKYNSERTTIPALVELLDNYEP